MPIYGEKKESASPVSKYLKWKGGGDAGHFEYWDGDKSENIIFELGEFVLLKVGYTIKGYSAAHKAGFWSNEIDYFSEELTVSIFNNGRFAKGAYKDIKADLSTAGAKLHIALTVLHKGEVIQFFLKGKAYYNFSELMKKLDQTQNKIKYIESVLMTDAASPYRLPSFEIGSVVTKKEGEQAVEAAGDLIEYRNNIKTAHTDKSIMDDTDTDEDLPF